MEFPQLNSKRGRWGSPVIVVGVKSHLLLTIPILIYLVVCFENTSRTIVNIQISSLVNAGLF